MGVKPNWSQSEIEYLSEQWGTKSILAISKKLGRSPNAIKLKAYKLKLGSFLDSGDYVSLNQIYAILGMLGGEHGETEIGLNDMIFLLNTVG